MVGETSHFNKIWSSRSWNWKCFSTICWFSMANTECYGIDIDQDKVDTINRGEIPIDGIEPLLPEGGFNPQFVHATTHWKTVVEREDIDAFFIAIPTERDGGPWWEPLKDIRP